MSANVRVFTPDFGNMIDLPGAGPCPRPVDLDQARTGFATLKSLRIYRFPAGVTIDGEAEDDEVLMALIAGAADVALFRDGAAVGEHRLREDGDERALYMPPHAAYRLTAVRDCDVAYARTQPEADAFPAPRGFAAADDGLRIDHAVGMTLSLARLADGSIMMAGDGSGERLVHVRSDGGAASIDAARLQDWDTAALATPAVIRAEGGATLLTIAAR